MRRQVLFFVLVSLIFSIRVYGQPGRSRRGHIYGSIHAVADSATLATLPAEQVGAMRYLYRYTSGDSISTGGWFMYADSVHKEGGTYAIHHDSTSYQWLRISSFEGLLPVSIKTATYTIKDYEARGTVFTNTGDTGSQVLNLPAAISGMHLEVFLSATEDVDINPDNSDRLSMADTPGDALSSDATIGSYIRIVAISDSVWAVTDTTGTWTDVN